MLTSLKLINGSSLLSSTLLEYLTENLEDSYAEFKDFLGPAVDACYGNLNESQLHRPELYQSQALGKKDGGSSSFPFGSFIMGNEFV